MSTSDEVIVMIGPSLSSKGGIASVVKAYNNAGLFNKWPIIYLNTHVEGTKVQKALVAFVALTKFLNLIFRKQVKLLHIHVPRRTAFWRKSIFILLAYLVKCPVLIHLHSGGFPDFYWKECGTVKKWIVRFVLDRTDRIIVLSSQWWHLLEAITNNKRLVKIPNFIIVTNGESNTLKQPNALNQNGDSILFLGRLIDEKGFFDLLDAIALIKDRFPNVKLLCGGEGEWGVVKAYIQRLGITSNIELLGWVNEEQKEHLLKNATIFVLPSHTEGLPMVVIEAMSKAVPVIATKIGGISDIIENGHDGVLVDSGEVKAIADAIVCLLEDARGRKEMGESGKNTVYKKFTSEQVLPKLEELYKEYGVRPCV